MFYENWVVACIIDFLIHSAHWLYYEKKTFFLWIGRLGYKKCVFLYCFQKCTFDCSKKCTQKRFAPKPIVLVVNRQNSFLDKDQIYIFEISMKRQIFLYSIRPTYTKKKLVKNTFWELKGQKSKKLLIIL
jgi:hypothetical protein